MSSTLTGDAADQGKAKVGLRLPHRLALGYRLYARYLADRVFALRADEPVPAHTRADGVDFVEALQLCSARAGCLVDLAGADAAAQVELARKLSERAQALTGGQPLRPWVRAVRSDAGWLWPNGDRVADALWTDGVPPEIGRCARFDAGGRLTATTCVGSGSTVCVFGDARAVACEVN